LPDEAKQHDGLDGTRFAKRFGEPGGISAERFGQVVECVFHGIHFGKATEKFRPTGLFNGEDVQRPRQAA